MMDSDEQKNIQGLNEVIEIYDGEVKALIKKFSAELEKEEAKVLKSQIDDLL